MSKIVITRKIQLFIQAEGQEFKDQYAKLRKWNEICFRAANHTATHQYFLENLSEFFYLHDDIKISLQDRFKKEEGILTTGRSNTTYQVNSKKFKGEAPMPSISALNNLVTSNIIKERNEYFSGKRSLRTYKRDIPMPLPVIMIKQWRLAADGENYNFYAGGITFRTNFSRDWQNNKGLMEGALNGASPIKLCDSSIKLIKKKIFLLAVFEVPKEVCELDPDKAVRATLSIDVPIECQINRKKFEIGTKEEFLDRRTSIQETLRRAQRAVTYHKSGKGRKKRFKSLDVFHEKEKNYVHLKLHIYSRKLVNLCRDHQCGKLILVNQKVKEEEAKTEENKFILRNWSYYGLIEMISYKAKISGIELIIE